MSYADAKAAVGPVKKGPTCTMCILLASLDDQDRTDVQADLDNPGVGGTFIGRTLAAAGHPIGQHVLDRHRRGQCSP